MLIRTKIMLLSCIVFMSSKVIYAVPAVTGEPVIIQHLGKIEWPQDSETISPSLTQTSFNDINDLHGNLSCELIISTPGNYHMALRDAMFGRPDLGHAGLIYQEGVRPKFKVNICWTTSPPISVDQITAEQVQFKNIKMLGRPALVMAPYGVMDTLVANRQVKKNTLQSFLTNKGNVILIRDDPLVNINNICDLGGETRVATPNPNLEPGSFSNFSDTIFNVAEQDAGCDATDLFNGIFTQDKSTFDLSYFNNPYNIDGVLSVFGRGSTPQGTGARWVASSRIMHRDIPYALCNDEADAGIIFYHLAKYLKDTLATAGCRLKIVPLGGTVNEPRPLPGNIVSTLQIAKVKGTYPRKVRYGRNIIYNFFTTSPTWEQILHDHGLTRN